MPMATPEAQREYQREWLRKRRETWIEANGPCVECGSDDRLEVDHIDRTTKVMQPTAIWSRRQEVRDAELAKCQVLCYDCHNGKSSEEFRALYTIQRECGTVESYVQGCHCESCTTALREDWREIRKVNKRLGYADNVDRRSHSGVV